MKIDAHQDGKPQRIEFKRAGDGQKNGDDDVKKPLPGDEKAADEEGEHHHGQDEPAAVRQAQQHGFDHLAAAQVQKDRVEDTCSDDDEKHHGGDDQGGIGRIPQGGIIQFSIAGRQDQGAQGPEARGFRRRSHAPDDRSEHRHDQQDGGQHLPGHLEPELAIAGGHLLFADGRGQRRPEPASRRRYREGKGRKAGARGKARLQKAWPRRGWPWGRT